MVSLTGAPAACSRAVGSVRDGDAVVTFNFRADRMTELSQVGWMGADSLCASWVC